MEVGKSLLPITRVTHLHKEFAEFRFDQLSRFFTFLFQLHDTHRPSALDIKIKEIGLLDVSLKELIATFEIDATGTGKNDTQTLKGLINIIKAKKLDVVLDRFLSSEYLPNPMAEEKTPFEKQILSKIKLIPSYDLDDVLDYLELRRRKRLQIANDTVVIWEKTHLTDIEEIYGVTQNHEDVTNLSNIEIFDYSYLWNGVKMKVMYLNTDVSLSADQVKKQFVNNILTVYKRNKSSKHRNDLEVKIHVDFKSGHSKLVELYTLMRSQIGKEETQFINFWAYKLKGTGHFVGFLANDQGNNRSYLGVSPSEAELEEKITGFNHIWSNL